MYDEMLWPQKDVISIRNFIWRIYKDLFNTGSRMIK